jgi:hypothetical protein
MKRFFIILLIATGPGKTSQIYQNPLLFGKEENRLNVLYDLGIPSDTFAVPAAKQAYPHIASKSGIIYLWSTTLLKWVVYSSGSSGTGISMLGTSPYGLTKVNDSTYKADTNHVTGLSTVLWRQKGIDSVAALIALKVSISDTAAMLLNYRHWLAGYLKISDTATMLGNYVNGVGYGLLKSGQVARADSATLSNYYLRRKDSLTTTNILGYVTKQVLADTAAAIRATTAAGTYTDEQAQDAVGTIMNATRFNYNDAANTIDLQINSITDSYLRQSAALSVIWEISKLDRQCGPTLQPAPINMYCADREQHLDLDSSIQPLSINSLRKSDHSSQGLPG